MCIIYTYVYMYKIYMCIVDIYVHIIHLYMYISVCIYKYKCVYI